MKTSIDSGPPDTEPRECSHPREKEKVLKSQTQLADPPLREALVTKEPLPCCTVLQATGNKSPSTVWTDSRVRHVSVTPHADVSVKRVRRAVGMVEGRGRTKELGQKIIGRKACIRIIQSAIQGGHQARPETGETKRKEKCPTH